MALGHRSRSLLCLQQDPAPCVPVPAEEQGKNSPVPSEDQAGVCFSFMFWGAFTSVSSRTILQI